jgi:hypothetical protein
MFGGFLWFFRDGDRKEVVRLQIENVPDGVYHASVVADSDDGVTNVHYFYPSPMGGDIRLHPADCNWALFGRDAVRRIDKPAYVDWVRAKRYGVVMMTQHGRWSVCWFDAAEVPLKNRDGEPAVQFDLAGRRREPLPDELCRSLELARMEPPSIRSTDPDPDP